jgi:hypothetical protein
MPLGIARQILIFCLCFAGARLLYADKTTVSFDSGDYAIFDNPDLHGGGDVPLTGGSLMVDGDGTVLQLGYYDGATTANNFLGNWVPLTGETSLNTATIPGSSPPEPYNRTSIGDITVKFAGDATFAMSLNFELGNAASSNSLPAVGSTPPLAIRFYNNTTIASSTYYNVVSDDSWLWSAPSINDPFVNVTISLNDLNLEWLSTALGQGAESAFHTTIPLANVPEPATWAGSLLMSAALSSCIRRRRHPNIVPSTSPD